MKQITTNNRTLLFVEVPEDAVECMVLNATAEFRYINPTFFDPVVYVQLPTGNYRLIATTDNISANLGITDTLLAEHGITGRHAIIEVL